MENNMTNEELGQKYHTYIEMLLNFGTAIKTKGHRNINLLFKLASGQTYAFFLSYDNEREMYYETVRNDIFIDEKILTNVRNFDDFFKMELYGDCKYYPAVLEFSYESV